MKNVMVLLGIGCLLPQPALAQRSVDEILREYQAAPRISWVIPLPYQQDRDNANPLEQHIVQFLAKRSSENRLAFWEGGIFAETSLPAQGTGSARVMPKLRPAAEIRILAAEMLFYPQVKDSPFSGDLLQGTLGHRSSGDFLTALLYDLRPPEQRITHLLSTPRAPTAKGTVQLGLTVEGSRARNALLRGTDVVAFIHFYGHGIQNEHGDTALVLPRHEFSATTFTGLTSESLLTATEALETFLNAAVGLPEVFIQEGLVPAEKRHEIIKGRRERDAKELQRAPASKRKLGIVIVMESCSVTHVKNATGEKRPHTTLSAAAHANALQAAVRKEWLDLFEKYLPLHIDTEIHLVAVADPGKRIAIAIDSSKWDIVPADDKIEMAIVGVDGRSIVVNPLNYGVLAPRIPAFLEESIYAASVARVPYRLSDVVNDIHYYKDRYLSAKSPFKSANDEQFKTAPIDYWRRMTDRHLTKDRNDSSLPIVGPNFAAVYVQFSPGAKVGSSKYQVDLQWRGSTRWNTENR